jgi:hypothetical protein
MISEPFHVRPAPIYWLGINWLGYRKAAHLGIVSSLGALFRFSGLI